MTEALGAGRVGPPERPPRARLGPEHLLSAALLCFHELGYGATSVREIAARGEVTVAALYHHFASKQDILFTLMRRAMEQALADIEGALSGAGDDPVERLSAVVAAHVRYHTVHQVEAFVGNSELRSLEPEQRRTVVALRDRHEALFVEVIAEGATAGRFTVDDPKDAARAVLAMCTAVASWYTRGGSQTVPVVERHYVRLALRTVGHDPARDACRDGCYDP